MNTNRNGVTENSFAKINLDDYRVNHDHIFNREKCKCEECEKEKEELVSEPKEDDHPV